MTRKLDALVAMGLGWHPHIYGNWPWQMQPPDKPRRHGIEQVRNVPNYSTDVAVAMGLEKKLSHFVLRRRGLNNWQCESAHCGYWGTHVTNDCGCKHANAETPALAISIATCRAYGVSEDEIQEAMNEEGDDTQP